MVGPRNSQSFDPGSIITDAPLALASRIRLDSCCARDLGVLILPPSPAQRRTVFDSRPHCDKHLTLTAPNCSPLAPVHASVRAPPYPILRTECDRTYRGCGGLQSWISLLASRSQLARRRMDRRKGGEDGERRSICPGYVRCEAWRLHLQHICPARGRSISRKRNSAGERIDYVFILSFFKRKRS